MARKADMEEADKEATGSKVTDSTNEVEDDHLDPIEERKELIEELFERAEAYAKTNVELYKLKATSKLSEIVASLIARIILIVFFSFFIFMLNIGLAVWIGEVLGHMYYGFFIVALIYLAMSVIAYVYRARIIKNPIIDSIISQVLK